MLIAWKERGLSGVECTIFDSLTASCQSLMFFWGRARDDASWLGVLSFFLYNIVVDVEAVYSGQ